ncbi:MAG TPA: DUF998 domain-containing protein [Pseudonocardiaceae bacterium]|nr:DUF998 domain-containing protein [Pseudonocardiaceae bacterium]
MVVNRAGRLCAASILALGVGAALILLLQFIPPTDRISPLHQTISEYGLSQNRWIFNVGVLLIVAGSITGFATLRRSRAVSSASLVFGALWTVGMLIVVLFPKHDWATGPHAGFTGLLHRYASVVAFACLPIAILSAVGQAFPDSALARWPARVLAVAALGWFAVILGAVVFTGGGAWWQVIPLGLVERGMAITELAALSALLAGGWRRFGTAPLPEPVQDLTAAAG